MDFLFCSFDHILTTFFYEILSFYQNDYLPSCFINDIYTKI